MTYNQLIKKHKTAIKAEYKKYADMGSTEINKVHFEACLYNRLIFDFNSGINHYRVETLDDIYNLGNKIKSDMKKPDRPYYNLKVSIDFHNIKTSGYLLTYKIDKILDYKHNTYSFKNHFKEIVRIEIGAKYISDMDCAVVKLYRDGVISFEQLIDANKSC